jgi:hypothetical protein
MNRYLAEFRFGLTIPITFESYPTVNPDAGLKATNCRMPKYRAVKNLFALETLEISIMIGH